MSQVRRSLKGLQLLQSYLIQADTGPSTTEWERRALSRLALQVDDLLCLKNSLINEIIRQRGDLARLQAILVDGGLLNACGVLQNSHQIELMAGRVYAMEELFTKDYNRLARDCPHLNLPSP